MSTPAQIAANRRNAAKSTGPKTPEGKLIVSRNALKHGLLSSRGLLFGEDPEEFEQFSIGVFHELAPETPIEVADAQRIISIMWRLRRIPSVDSARYAWNRYAMPPDDDMGFDEQQFRGRVARAITVQHQSLSPADPAPTHDQLERLTESIMEHALFGYAWRTDSGELWRYETKLQRQLDKLLAAYYKRKHEREVSAARNQKMPNKANVARQATGTVSRQQSRGEHA